jgi:putative transposase
MEQKIIVDQVLKKRKQMARLGTRKLHFILQPEFERIGIKCGRDRLFSILRQECMLVKKKKNFTRTTNSMHRFRKYPNLIEGLQIKRPEQVWVSDITYIRTKRGFLYHSLITDAFSKQIMGFELADNLRAESSINALKMAIKKRRYPKRKLIHHSDRGLQYCTPVYTNLLLDNKIKSA